MTKPIHEMSPEESHRAGVSPILALEARIRSCKQMADLADLHSHVDANEYGGLCDPEVVGVFETFDALLDFANEVQDSVDAWLRSDDDESQDL